MHIVIHDDEVEVREALGAGNTSWLPCFDVTIGGNCSLEKARASQFCYLWSARVPFQSPCLYALKN